MITPRIEARRAMAMTLAFDVIAAAAAMAMALYLSWSLSSGWPPNPLETTAMASSVFAFSGLLSFWIVGVHRQVWRHISWGDVVRVIQAAGLAALFFLPVLFLWNRLVGFPRSSLALALPVWLLILFAGRMVAIARTTQTPFQIFQTVRKDAPMVVLAADSASAAELLKHLQRDPDGAGVRILGMVDVDASNPGRAIRGVPVYGGIDDLGNVLDILEVRYGSMPWVAATGPARDASVMTRLLKEVAARGSKVMALDPEGPNGAGLKQVRPRDLLARPERDLDSAPVEKLLSGANVLITGAGGSIGSELVRQCARFGPSRIGLFDSSEYNLYQVDLFVRRRRPDLPVTTILGNVRSPKRLSDAMSAVAPHVVIHAAALKHVPLMEENVCEAILTNVGGTLNAARAARNAGARNFVLISTDKAVDPDNIMGATKRIAELAVQRIAQDCNMDIAMVRFGNVLGSSGSVVPLFEDQINRGGPVTVTDPEVTRYFMTVEEATSLVLQAAALNGHAEGRNLFVLDMGEPVRIRELAEAMVRMKGLVPGRDIAIEYTGLRPGEKLHEALTYEDEAVNKTVVDGVMSVNVDCATPPQFDLNVERLLEAAGRHDRVEALRLLSMILEEYTAYGQQFRRRKRA